MNTISSPSPTLAMPARVIADAMGEPDPTFGVRLVTYRGELVGVIGARGTHHDLNGAPCAFVWEV